LAYFAARFQTCLYDCSIPIPELKDKQVEPTRPYPCPLGFTVLATEADHDSIARGKGTCGPNFAVEFYKKIQQGIPQTGLPTNVPRPVCR
jgi:hypothetical protein